MPQACNIMRPAPRVGRNGKLRIIALVSYTQEFVAVCLKKAQAQRIPWFRMPQACNIKRPAPRVGRNGKLRITALVSCTQKFVAVCLKKAQAQRIPLFRMPLSLVSPKSACFSVGNNFWAAHSSARAHLTRQCTDGPSAERCHSTFGDKLFILLQHCVACLPQQHVAFMHRPCGLHASRSEL